MGSDCSYTREAIKVTVPAVIAIISIVILNDDETVLFMQICRLIINGHWQGSCQGQGQGLLQKMRDSEDTGRAYFRNLKCETRT